MTSDPNIMTINPKIMAFDPNIMQHKMTGNFFKLYIKLLDPRLFEENIDIGHQWTIKPFCLKLKTVNCTDFSAYALSSRISIENKSLLSLSKQ